MSDDVTLIIEVGRKLFGEQWQTSFARACKRNPRTVRKWVAKATPVPADVKAALPDIVLAVANNSAARGVELRAYSNVLRKGAGP